jgi:hypothetical protein
MTFIYFTDDEGSEIGVPAKSITELKFDKDTEGDPESDELKVEINHEEYYEITGKAARKAWDEIRFQIQATVKHHKIPGINQ